MRKLALLLTLITQPILAAQAKEKEALVVNKLPDIIMTRWDDLTTAQKNQLIAIAAAFP
jgi:hypothetical protein